MPKKIMMLMLAAALLLAAGCRAESAEEIPSEDVMAGTAGWRSTVVYYSDDAGRIVPLMKRIPWEEGIGKAALGLLVATPENAASAARMGLSCPVPAGTEFELRISELGVAAVNVIGLPDLGSAQAEQRMVAAIVNTLAEFDTIDAVTLRFDGEAVKTLPNGMAVQDELAALPLNLESTELTVSAGEARLMTYYCPNEGGSLNIPVSRYVSGEPTFAGAVSAMVEGSAVVPRVFPAGTRVLSAGVENGVATVDLSSEFLAAADTDGLYLAVYDALFLNAAAYGGAERLIITVEGERLTIDGAPISAPRFVNEYAG